MLYISAKELRKLFHGDECAPWERINYDAKLKWNNLAKLVNAYFSETPPDEQTDDTAGIPTLQEGP